MNTEELMTEDWNKERADFIRTLDGVRLDLIVLEERLYQQTQINNHKMTGVELGQLETIRYKIRLLPGLLQEFIYHIDHRMPAEE